MGFSEGWQGSPVDFPRKKTKGNTVEKPCKDKENPVHPSYLTDPV